MSYYGNWGNGGGQDVYEGDARRCHVHPQVKTSSDNGMFDGLCHFCEGEMDAAYEQDMEREIREEGERLAFAQLVADLNQDENDRADEMNVPEGP